jgi:hypothetical protein
MANYKTAFPSKYLSAADLEDSTPVVVVKKITSETVGDDSKLVAYFEGKEKGVVLNKTNANSLAELAKSDDTDDWPGTRVMLIVVKVEYQGKRVPGIRMEAPPRERAGRARASAPPEPDDERQYEHVDAPPDDDIPF